MGKYSTEELVADIRWIADSGLDLVPQDRAMLKPHMDTILARLRAADELCAVAGKIKEALLNQWMTQKVISGPEMEGFIKALTRFEEA